MIQIIHFRISHLNSNPSLPFNNYMALGILHSSESISSSVKQKKTHILRELNEMLT